MLEWHLIRYHGLPKIPGKYLVTYVNPKGKLYIKRVKFNGNKFSRRADPPLAWMPSPKPCCVTSRDIELARNPIVYSSQEFLDICNAIKKGKDQQ